MAGVFIKNLIRALVMVPIRDYTRACQRKAPRGTSATYNSDSMFAEKCQVFSLAANGARAVKDAKFVAAVVTERYGDQT
jgi:hypothetical protein